MIYNVPRTEHTFIIAISLNIILKTMNKYSTLYMKKEIIIHIGLDPCSTKYNIKIISATRSA